MPSFQSGRGHRCFRTVEPSHQFTSSTSFYPPGGKGAPDERWEQSGDHRSAVVGSAQFFAVGLSVPAPFPRHLSRKPLASLRAECPSRPLGSFGGCAALPPAQADWLLRRRKRGPLPNCPALRLRVVCVDRSGENADRWFRFLLPIHQPLQAGCLSARHLRQLPRVEDRPPIPNPARSSRRQPSSS